MVISSLICDYQLNLKIMKKVLVLLLLLVAGGALISSAEEKTEIPIRKGPTYPIPPRMPDYACDITAYYQSGVIYLNFGSDMGEVEITVTNETTGEQWSQTDDTAFGATTITTSTDAGDYSITIVSATTTYIGNFSL